jgi:hypothetical protein
LLAPTAQPAAGKAGGTEKDLMYKYFWEMAELRAIAWVGTSPGSWARNQGDCTSQGPGFKTGACFMIERRQFVTSGEGHRVDCRYR